jgi:hypothetical protein
LHFLSKKYIIAPLIERRFSNTAYNRMYSQSLQAAAQNSDMVQTFVWRHYKNVGFCNWGWKGVKILCFWFLV